MNVFRKLGNEINYKNMKLFYPTLLFLTVIANKDQLGNDIIEGNINDDGGDEFKKVIENGGVNP